MLQYVSNPTDLALFEGTLYWLRGGTGQLNSYRLYGPYVKRAGKLDLYIYNVEHFAILQSSAQPRGTVCIEFNCLKLNSCGGVFSMVFLPFISCDGTLDLKHTGKWYNK
jgi:hypothetical protein